MDAAVFTCRVARKPRHRAKKTTGGNFAPGAGPPSPRPRFLVDCSPRRRHFAISNNHTCGEAHPAGLAPTHP